MTGGDLKPTKKKLPRKVMTARLRIRVMGDGWISFGSRKLKVPDKIFHSEYSSADGSTKVRKGKKRTHKAFGPFVITQE